MFSNVAFVPRSCLQGSYGVLKSMERSSVIFQSGKKILFGLLVWKEKRDKNFPYLIF